MPCNPKDIRIGYYSLPSTLQRAEREEVAARILSFSQQLDQWVGVSWSRMVDMLNEDIKNFKEVNDAQKHNFDEEWRFSGAMRKYRTLCLFTLGLYAIFGQKPTKNLQEVPKKHLPFTTIIPFGSTGIVNGIHELVEHEMLKQVDEGEGDDAINIFFPTPKLISTIMAKQGVATA